MATLENLLNVEDFLPKKPDEKQNKTKKFFEN